MGNGIVEISRGGKFMGAGFCGNLGIGQRNSRFVRAWRTKSDEYDPQSAVASADDGADRRQAKSEG
jgi:hypothetical protein